MRRWLHITAASTPRAIIRPYARRSRGPTEIEFPDNTLCSALGRHDGNVYESLFAGAKASALNAQDPFDGYERHLQPSLDQEFLEEHRKMMSAPRPMPGRARL